MNQMKSTLIAMAVSLTLAACAVQPATHANLPDQVAHTAPTAFNVDVPKDPVDADTWWQQFGDPVMHDLVTSVLNQNLDVQAAVERVKQAEAQTTVRRAALLPELNASGTASTQRVNVPPPAGYVREAGFGLSASWSPDVFGGERLALLASQAQVKGTTEALNQLRLALAANTADAYVELRWAQTELQILQDNEQIRERTLRLTQERLQYGLSTNLDVARAKNQLSDLQSRIPGVQSTIQHQLSLIAVYSGRTPESVSALVFGNGDIPVPKTSAPNTLPSEALLRRPDVREAYAGVEQHAAEVGAAKAEWYPKFSLNLTDSLVAASYLGMPALTNNLFGAALGVTSPIFNAGRINADIAKSQSQMRESELNLRQTMLNALKDIEDTRSDLVSSAGEVDRLGSALDASSQALRLSNELYKGGASSFLDVLDAQESYLRDDDSLNRAKRDRALAAVALYRALGGGWQAGADDTAIAQKSGGQREPAPQAVSAAKPG